MRKWVWVVVALLLIAPAVAAEGDVAKHKLLILDSPYAIIEDWTDLTYTRERFGLGQFQITLPIDHNQASALVEYNRVLIVRGDDNWDNQDKRLWGIILNVKKHYAEDAGPDTGGSGIGAAFVTATGVTFTEYFLSSRVYPTPASIDLAPDGAGDIAEWTGTYANIDEGVDNHDGDTTYINSEAYDTIALFTLGNYVDQGAVIAGIRVRSVWRTVNAGVITPAIVLKLPDHNEILSSPIADGTDTGTWAGAYTDVDDDPTGAGDGDATYISSSTVGHQESYVFQSIGVGKDAFFNRVLLHFKARKTTADTVRLLPYVLIDGVRYYSDPMTIGTDYEDYDYTGAWGGDPVTTEFWTANDINNAEFGIEVDTCDGGEARITMVWLEGRYLFEYQLGPVEDSYEERYVDLANNPATEDAWTEADLDGLQVGVLNLEDWDARVTTIDVRVYHGPIQTAGPLDDVLKAWVNANLGSGAAADRQVTGFTEEADESAFPPEDEGDELVTNGGFPSDTSGWTAGNSATLASAVGGQSGNCLRVTENGDPGPYAYQDIAVEAGKFYKFSVYVKQGTESTYDIRLRDEENVAYLYSITGESTASWVQKTCYFTAPSGCSTVRIFLIQIAPVGGTTLFYDTVVCKEDVYPAYEIAYNVLLQRFLALCKANDVGMDIVGAWAAGATQLDAAASYEFQTSSPEGTDRTHTQSVNDPVIISRGRGLSRLLNYELDAVTARNVAYALGEKDGLKQIKQTTEGGAAKLAKEDGGLLLKEDGWPIQIEGIPAFLRRECVLDVENADTTTQLTAEGTKFLNDEAAELEMVSYGHQSGQDMYVPLADFNPGDLITYYDDKLSIGPLTPVVEAITCHVPSDGVEQYEVALGAVKRAALSEDAAFRATGKRKTLFVKQ